MACLETSLGTSARGVRSLLEHLVGLLLSLVAEPVVRMEGACRCPTAQQVAQQLDRLLPAGPAGLPPDRARIDADSDGVRLRLTRADGTVIGEKGFARERSCAELAEAVALVLAIWEWPLRPGLVPPPELGHRPSVAGARGGADVAAPARPDAASPPEAWRFELGMAFQEVAPGPAPGGFVEAVIRDAAGRWGGRLSLSATWWHDIALGTGRVSWTRPAAGVALVRGWSGARLFLDLQAQLSLAALVARGHDFDENRTRMAFDPGFGPGIRGGTAWGRLGRVWVNLGMTVWPLNQRLQVEQTGVSPAANVSRLEAALSVGGSFSTHH